ncbi:NAD-dependent epimerase/dehydratase family protein [Paenibacillus massiliensis]|uniref:NAD-dependent epimerase/dehydratase family protein n=1 Tax=Paenibacillus massiliensis TaxID=225917 RepID=UPI00046F905A|nr:SDR family NAD(P)-dependent oxidoreductase [Paenibacillus massiliensis]
MKKAVVTGASGFIGRHVVKELSKNDVEVIAVVRNSNSDVQWFSTLDNVHIIYCDLSNIAQLMSQMDGADTFYHFAWEGSSGAARSDYQLQLQNVNWTIDCLKLAKNIGCKRFVGVGSIMEKEAFEAAYAQGNTFTTPYLYGIGKVTAHSICKALAAELNIEFVWTYITNAFGPGEVSPRFINTTLRKVMNNEPLQFTSATQNYDFIYKDDAARAFYLVGEKGRDSYSYVIGSGRAQPLKNYILSLKQSVATDQPLEFGNVPFTGINVSLEQFSTQLLLEHTGFKPEISFEDGIVLTYEWLKQIK